MANRDLKSALRIVGDASAALTLAANIGVDVRQIANLVREAQANGRDITPAQLHQIVDAREASDAKFERDYAKKMAKG